MKKWTRQDRIDLFRKWIEFVFTNFLLSIAPFGFVLGAYHFSGYEIRNHEYIPDLIMVSFAVCVNIFNIAWGEKKRGLTESLAFCFSILAILGCTAMYYFTMGIIMELNEQIEKFSRVYSENPKDIGEVANDLKLFLEDRVHQFEWTELLICTILILFICAIFGTIMVVKTFWLEKKDNFRLPNDLYILIEDARNSLSTQNYEKIIYDIEVFHQQVKQKIASNKLEELNKDAPSKKKAGE